MIAFEEYENWVRCMIRTLGTSNSSTLSINVSEDTFKSIADTVSLFDLVLSSTHVGYFGKDCNPLEESVEAGYK